MEIRRQAGAVSHSDDDDRSRPIPTFEAASLSALLRDTLPAPLQARLVEHIRTRRWFRGKARTIREIAILDQLPLRSAPKDVILIIIRVSYVVEDSEMYALALAHVARADAERASAALPLLFQLQPSSGDPGVICDLTGEEEFSQLLLDLFVREPTAGERGVITAHPTAALAARAAHDRPAAHQSTGEQSNTTVFFGREFMLKLFRQLEAGENPDVEVNEFLWAHGYRHVPEPLGSLRYDGAFAATLGIAQRYVSSEGTAWDATLRILRRSLEQARALEPPPVRSLPGDDVLGDPGGVDSTSGVFESYSGFAMLLGKRTAELHLALASDAAAPAFSPEPFTIDYQRSMLQAMHERVDRAYELLARQLDVLPDDVKPLAEEVFACGDSLRANLGALDSLPVHASRIRCHGDFHLGQVLYGAGDFTILDFEGEPAQLLERRRQKGSALYDVGGMLRSFHYASTVARHGDAWQQRGASLERWGEAWYRWASAAFLSAYLKRAREAGAAAVFLPDSRDELRALLRLHLIDKCCYELSYELNNRPAWVGVPIAGLLSLAGAR
jgi:maltose alpha-D-glucosyltransferase/alpha-amylase